MGYSMTEIEKNIGQLFIIGFPGEMPSSSFLDFIAEENIGGVILFGDNCPTHQLTKRNVEMIRRKMGASFPFIAVDQEGGRVSRIKKAPAEIKAAWKYGTKLGLEQFREDYTRSAVLMESLGINLNLAPVCDIFLDEKNACMNDRCFGTTPEEVVPFVSAAVKIAHRAGLLSCLKHFPGLGAATVDPHEGPATIDYDEIIYDQRELVPFAAGVEYGADLVMTTHVKVKGLDDKIVTESERVMTSLLRQKLGFDGPVITDELGMKGADDLGHPGERALAAFNAGHDLLLFGQDLESSVRAVDYFKDSFLDGEISRERIRASLDRVAGIKFKLGKSTLL